MNFFLTEEKIINHEKGNIFHIIKKDSSGYNGFGEAYISSVNANSIKGWKMHKQMTLNLLVILGKIRFVIFNSYFALFINKNTIQGMKNKIKMIVHVNDFIKLIKI